MARPITNTFNDEQGNSFNSDEAIKGIIKNWGTIDIVSQINAPVSAEAITDADGKIVRYKYLKMSFGNIVNRKTLVDKDRTGSVSGKILTGSEITVDLDDERAIEPFYIDNWDAKKLSSLVGLKAAKEGEYTILPQTERAERYFEALRKVAKAGDAAALNDGITRVVDITAATSDAEKLYDLYSEAVAEMASVKNSNRKGTPKAFMALVLPPKQIKLIAKLLWATGSPSTKEGLENGVIAKINGVPVYESINTQGKTIKQGFLVIRGAVVLPMGNAEMVQYPSKSNSFMGSFEWATCKQGSEGVLYADGVVAFGDPAEIKA